MTAESDRARDPAGFDVIIAGGGPVGATVAALLARESRLPAARILLLAPDLAHYDQPFAADAPVDLRVVALSRGSQSVLERAGVWQRLPAARLCAYERMRIWHESLPPDGLGTLSFDAAEMAVSGLGHIVESRLITSAALDAFREAGGRLLNASVERLQQQGQQVQLESTTGVFTTRLLVGADGARSRVRELVGLPVHSHAYGQSAIVGTIATARPHQHTAWQRFLAGGPVALLPLHTGECSIVWTAQDARAQALMTLPPDEFSRQLAAATDFVLGETRLVSARAIFPLQRATATRLTAPRTALVGDAAHQIHPLAGQGVNLGFLDVAALCESVAQALVEREDPGSARTLRRYEQQRLTHDTLMSWSMSAFNALFSQGGAAGWVGSRLLGATGMNGLLRRQLARRAMGLTGTLPAAMSP